MILIAFDCTKIACTTSGWKLCICLYFSEKLLRVAGNFSRDNLISIGTKFGRFNKNHKFRLHITALDYLAKYAQVIHLVMAIIGSIRYG